MEVLKQVSDNLLNWAKEDQRIIVGNLIAKLGDKQRQQLLSFFSATDLDFLFSKKKKSECSSIYLIASEGQRLDLSEAEKSLESLGIEVYSAPKLELLFSTKTNELIKLNQNPVSHKHDPRELNLLLMKDVPDNKDRNAIIELFFTEGGYQKYVNIFLLQTIKDIEDTLGNKRDIDRKPEVYSIGNSFKEVEEEKIQYFGLKQLKIIRRIRPKVASVISFNNMVEKRKNKLSNRRKVLSGNEKAVFDYYQKKFEEEINKNDGKKGIIVSEEWYDYVITQKEELEEFVKSTFCFCVSQLAQIPSNIAWVIMPNSVEFEIPDWVKQKMELISSISECYDINPKYHNLLKNATRAFIRVHNGV